MTDAPTSAAHRVARPAAALGATVPPRLEHRVSSSLLANQVFEQLHARIVVGELPPGTQLRIRDIAVLMGTSEMPVREAFRRLDQAGLIVIEPYRGATVRALSIDELEHIYDVRIMLEPEAGRQGAEVADDAVVEAMNQHWALLRAASERGDIDAAVTQDEHLLSALYTAGGNDVLAKLVRQLWDTCRPYKNLWVTNAVERGLSAWGHLPQLLDAVACNDSEAAFTVLDRTYRDARATVRNLLDTQSGRNQ